MSEGIPRVEAMSPISPNQGARQLTFTNGSTGGASFSHSGKENWKVRSLCRCMDAAQAGSVPYQATTKIIEPLSIAHSQQQPATSPPTSVLKHTPWEFFDKAYSSAAEHEWMMVGK